MIVWTTQNYIWRLPVSSGNHPPRALLVDQLALNYPDPSFVTNITSTLSGGGYKVDYTGPMSNAVDFFKQLPTNGYDLIIIRAHQGGDQSIITTEPYSTSKYVSDQNAGTLDAAEVGGVPTFFALTPKFIRQDMQGRFPGSTIVIMGCAALQGSQDLASAFLDKGANFFVGWDTTVTIIHTDTITVAFAQQLAAGRSVPESTRIAGIADPIYGARLHYLAWDTLVQGRVDSLKAALSIWISIGAILVLGPLAVFLVPKLFDLVDGSRRGLRRRKNHSDRKAVQENDSSPPK